MHCFHQFLHFIILVLFLSEQIGIESHSTKICYVYYKAFINIMMQEISVMPLGAGCQVGRSCIILTINKKKIMLDCGQMIGRQGRDAFPLFQKIQASQLSMILITHAHLDHCGALPYYLSSTTYNKKVYMTQPTKDIYKYLLKDSLKVRSEEDRLFTSEDIESSLRKVTKVDFGVEVIDDDIKIIPYCAGHIVGAAMFLIEVDGLRVLYTGDYSCEEDRYIMKAEIPDVHVDVLIVESTYGVRKHQPRAARQNRFTKWVEKIVTRKGKCLLPVFSAGRAEQLLHILDQHWELNSHILAKIKIYYTCALIEKCKKVYEFYINMLSKRVQEKFYKQKGNNPFEFKYISYLKSNSKLENEERNDQGLVVMCTPGMLQSGQSRTLFERWCHDPKNGLILTGYCVEGSLASGLKKGDRVQKENGEDVDVRMDVEEISFSAHADCNETTEFIKKVEPSYVVLVHGSPKNASDLQKHLEEKFPQIKKICCPKNELQERFQIQKQKKMQIAGQLKDRIENYSENAKNRIVEEGAQEVVLENFKGVLVNTGDQVVLVEEKQKEKFFPEHQSIKINQRLMVQYGGSWSLALLLATNVFGDCKSKIIDGCDVMLIKDAIKMTIIQPRKTACLEFVSSPRNDIMADEFGFLLSNIPDDPQWDPFGGDFQNDRVHSIVQIVRGQYPDSRVLGDKFIEVRDKEELVATINLDSNVVKAADPGIQQRLEAIVKEASL